MSLGLTFVNEMGQEWLLDHRTKKLQQMSGKT